jgi:predicted transposase YdaD
VKAHFAELLLIGFGSEKGEIEIEFIRTLYLYLYAVSGGITTEEIYEQIESIDNQNKTTVMENFIDELLEKGERIGEERGIQIGKEQGIQIGKERGMEIGKKRAVYQAYQNGCSIAMLSNIFALSETEAQKIIDEVESWDKAEKS